VGGNSWSLSNLTQFITHTHTHISCFTLFVLCISFVFLVTELEFNNRYLWSGVMTQTARPLCLKNPVHTAGVRKFRSVKISLEYEFFSLINTLKFLLSVIHYTVSYWMFRFFCRWSLVNEDWFATIGGQGTVSIWDKTQPKVPLTYQNSTKAGGISWIYGEPYLVTGGDQQLHFWLVGGPHQ
jgi:hypothetical protein